MDPKLIHNETIMSPRRQARELWKTDCFQAARRGSYGKRNVVEPPGAGAMENVLFWSHELPKTL
jgi:hypothetical protein